jgi:hypothetical protein
MRRTPPAAPKQEVESTVKRLVSHVFAAVLEGGLIALLVAGLVVGTAFAAKGRPAGGGGTTGSSIRLASPIVVDKNGDGVPNWGDTVAFEISTTATATPYVDLKCYQGTKLVAEGWRGYFADSLDTHNFGLYAGTWGSGAADCTAYLDAPSGRKGGMTQLAHVTYHVDA